MRVLNGVADASQCGNDRGGGGSRGAVSRIQSIADSGVARTSVKPPGPDHTVFMRSTGNSSPASRAWRCVVSISLYLLLMSRMFRCVRTTEDQVLTSRTAARNSRGRHERLG